MVTTPDDLERVAKWLGYPFTVFEADWHRPAAYISNFDDCASQWDVTGAIFDKLRADGLTVIVEWMNDRCTIQLAGKLWVADTDQHAAAIACAAKYAGVRNDSR